MNKIIQVMGAGCPSCKRLLELTKQVVSELALNSNVEYITDFAKMAELGIMSSPALVVDGKVVVSGTIPSLDELKKLLS